MEKLTKEQFKNNVNILKKLESYKDIEIKETWFYDWEKLDDEIKELQKLFRLIKKERKLQPEIETQSILTNEVMITKAGYNIMIGNDDKIMYCKDW